MKSKEVEGKRVTSISGGQEELTTLRGYTFHCARLALNAKRRCDHFLKAAVNKIPQTGWFKTTEIYSLTILEARTLKSRCQWGYAPSETLGRTLPCLFELLVVTVNPWLAAASLHSLPLSSQHSYEDSSQPSRIKGSPHSSRISS